jgi:hypothetical protein
MKVDDARNFVIAREVFLNFGNYPILAILAISLRLRASVVNSCFDKIRDHGC